MEPFCGSNESVSPNNTAFGGRGFVRGSLSGFRQSCDFNRQGVAQMKNLKRMASNYRKKVQVMSATLNYKVPTVIRNASQKELREKEIRATLLNRAHETIQQREVTNQSMPPVQRDSRAQ